MLSECSGAPHGEHTGTLLHFSAPPLTRNLRAPPGPATPRDKVKIPPLAPGVSLRKGEGKHRAPHEPVSLFLHLPGGSGTGKVSTLGNDGVGAQVLPAR